MTLLTRLFCLACLPLAALAQDFTLAQFLNIQSAGSPTFRMDGLEVAYMTNTSGQPQVWRTFDRQGPTTQVTFEEDGVDGAWWSPVNPLHLIVAASRGGNERSKLYLLNPNQSPMLPLTPWTMTVSIVSEVGRATETLSATRLTFATALISMFTSTT
ncbi:MAG: hypothetical protein IPH10_02510 [bacterium]|nr:hypothetical protein [bacterium]